MDERSSAAVVRQVTLPDLAQSQHVSPQYMSAQAVSLELASLWNRAKELLDVADTSALSQAVANDHSRMRLPDAGMTTDGIAVRR